MEVEYYDFPDAVAVDDTAEFEFPRTFDLLHAIRQNRDFSLVSLAKKKLSEELAWELVTVDVECDRVPPSNPHGILYRERLTLAVPKDSEALVEVVAIRKSFPVMIHQNQGAEGTPASLCLYFEPVVSVLRTWTAQKFLRRIQWWLEASSRGELHSSDQPVEHLFFATNYELVLPWNFKQPNAGERRTLRFTSTARRPDGGFTVFVDQEKYGRSDVKVSFYEFTLPPVVHGFIESDPTTLGGLVNYLQKRDVDLKSKLIAELRQRIPTQGLTKSEGLWTITLLHIPVVREPGGVPERFNHRAYLSLTDELELGEKLGAYIKVNGTYFTAAGVLGVNEPEDWKSLPILSLDVLRTNSAEAARLQSGISAAGPKGVLVGAGAVGSALLNFWGRGGWGDWTVIDDDHFKPHNISRHVAQTDSIGFPKADVAAHLHTQVANGATTAKPVVANALKIHESSVAEPLRTADLVVDASATLEYPRLASTVEKIGRHVSVFMTPNGNSSVLLAEDVKRDIRLRTLEAQYYRAVIQNSWGASHLEGLSNFRSGASCRDISVVMSYTKVMAHVGTLCEHIQQARAVEGALIRVWVRDPATGVVSFQEIPTYPERALDFGTLTVYFDAGLEERLHQLREAAIPNETGGVLVGYFDLALKMVCIVDCLSAPPDSKANAVGFERGTEGLADAVNEIARRTVGVVGYIGEWHSHPRGHSADESRDDIIQLIHLAQGMADDGLPALQLIVGEGELQILQGKMA